MPRYKRPRCEPTDDYDQLALWANGPEHRTFELIRPVVLFGQLPAERRRETGAAERTIRRKANRFDAYGMASLFTDDEAPRQPSDDRTDRRALPPDLRQLIVDLEREYPPLRPKELATICYLKCGRKPAPHTIQRVLDEDPPPSYTARRYPPYDAIADPGEARLTIIRLHAEGWSVGSIGSYLDVSRKTVWRTLRRWVEEGVKGLDDKPHTRKRVALKTTLRAVATVKRLQQNPELGAWRLARPRRPQAPGDRTQPAHLRAHPRPEPAALRPGRSQAEPRRRRHCRSLRRGATRSGPLTVRYLEDGKIHHLGGGNIYVISVLDCYRIFYATRFGRVLDKAGYVRFRCWRLYGEAGLARRPAAVWLYRETLTVEFADQPVAQYSVAYQPDHTHLTNVTNPRLFETPYRSPQLPLWELGDGEWLKFVWLGRYAPRRAKRIVAGAQLPLFALDVID